MKNNKYINNRVKPFLWSAFSLLFILISGKIVAQDSSMVAKAEPVKYTFEGTWIVNNQTTMVPLKGAVQMDIQHRFGTVNNGWEDVYGVFAPSNIRLGLAYVPMKNLMIGAGLSKEMVSVDLNAKYAILHQTPGSMPVSVTYFGNIAIDTRDQEFRYNVHRLSYFNQLIIARKLNNKISLQTAPGLSWFNNVEAYLSSSGEIKKKMENLHVSIAFSGIYKFNKTMGLVVNYDQPITQHKTNNPDPNLSVGMEFSTGSHVFQVFLANYYYIVPQNGNFYNQNDYRKNQYLIGFNISRLWD